MKRSIPLAVVLLSTCVVAAAAQRGAIPPTAPVRTPDGPVDKPYAGPGAPDAAFRDCAGEAERCGGAGWAEVRYGARGKWRVTKVEGAILCSNSFFGDPAFGIVKRCERRALASPPPADPNAQPMVVTPVASNFARLSEIGPARIPATGKPDVVGAFRMICQPSHNNYDDPVLYPGKKGGSPHGHTWFGNTGGDYRSTYASLRAAGGSTCMGPNNRSAYWVPWMENAAGRVIMPDYITLYYKRRPVTDPECKVMVPKGCADLPTGLRAVSGYDMRRMGERQPENRTFHWRCIAPGGKPGGPQTHRETLPEAVADCGGEGQVMAGIGFGGCWNGMLDSLDHRSHLKGGRYNNRGQYVCDKGYDQVIPELTQGVAYTVKRSDGAVRLSSDVMGGMRMTPGSTFHADYMEAWDPPTRRTWHDNCIDKLLTCVDGELGDGTIMKRPAGFGYTAEPRLAAAPARPG